MTGVLAPPARRAAGSGRRPVFVIAMACGAVLLVLSIAFVITIGPASLSVPDVYRIVLGHLGAGDGAGVSKVKDAIVWELRLPRTLLAALCGAGLALCGVVLQSLLRNVLADPFVLGVSSGASVGAVSVAVLGVGGGVLSLSAGAFAGALVSFGLVLALAYGAGGGTSRIVLAGVAGTQLFSALTSFIVISSADAEQTRGVLFWLLGSLGGADWTLVTAGAVVLVVVLAVCLAHAPALDAFTFGNSAASALGVSVVRVRTTLLVATALLTAVLVAAAGAIGFVGLVVPHAARFLVGATHSRLLPAAALAGALFMVWVDAVARTVFEPQEVPVGVVTALVGVPAFAVILFRMRGSHS